MHRLVLIIKENLYQLRKQLIKIITGRCIKEWKAQLRRFRNQRHRFDFPSENNGWVKYKGNPVVGDKTTGTVFDPYVLEYDGKLVMVASFRQNGSLELLESSDGFEWHHLSCLLQGYCNSQRWDSKVNRGCLLNVQGIWHLWYTGQSEGKSRIGHLTARDLKSLYNTGIDRHNGPVISPTLVEEGTSVMNPCVIWNDSRKIFQMWYSAGDDYEPDVICYAESEDGEFWTKHNVPVLSAASDKVWEQQKIGGCHVHRDPATGQLIMYYIGYQNVDVARICMAKSSDGIEWQRDSMNLCLSPSAGTWDCDSVYKPSFISFQDSQFIYYNGRKGHVESIGVAYRAKKLRESRDYEAT